MLKLENFDFKKIIKEKMEMDNAEYLTEEEIIENGDDDMELMLLFSPVFQNRKIPNGYVLNPVGMDKIKTIFDELNFILEDSGTEYEAEIESAAISYDTLAIKIKCNFFTISHNQKPHFLRILSVAESVDTYARVDGKMVISIEVKNCLMPV